MAGNYRPLFELVPRIGIARLTTAETSLDAAPTNVVSVLAASANHTRIDRVVVKAAQAITVAGMVRLWLHDGSTYRLFEELTIPVDTVGANDTSYTTESDLISETTPLVLPSGWTLYATTEKSDKFNVIAFGGDLGS